MADYTVWRNTTFQEVIRFTYKLCIHIKWVFSLSVFTLKKIKTAMMTYGGGGGGGGVNVTMTLSIKFSFGDAPLAGPGLRVGCPQEKANRQWLYS